MKTIIKKLQIAAVLFAAIALTTTFTACKGENKNKGEGRGDLINEELINLEGTTWICTIKSEKWYRQLHIFFESETQFYFIEYKAGDPEGHLYGEGAYKVEDSSAESKTILFYDPNGVLVSSMQLQNNTIVHENETGVQIYVNIENTGFGDDVDEEFAEIPNVNLIGTKWVAEYSGGDSEVYVFKTATEYEHYFLIDGDVMGYGESTYTVEGNIITRAELGEFYVMMMEGDQLADYGNGTRVAYEQQK